MRKIRFLRLVLCASVLAACTPSAQAQSQARLFVYRGAGCTGASRIASFNTLIGRTADGVTEFTEQTDWAHMLSSANWALGCWAGKPYKMAQSVPMLMQKGTTLQEGAAGAYDGQFASFGRLLVAKGYPDAYLRIGWEFNGNWYTWAAAKDPEAFKAYFRRIVAAFRSVPGQRFQIVWNPAMGQQQISPERAYPGDDVVDVIGLDVYNQSWRPQDATDPVARWDNLVKQPFGLDWVRTFAAAHGKPIAIPEWGTGTRPDGHGWGDDPMFVTNMAVWIKSNNVVYHSYWDYNAGDYNAEISTGKQPKAAAAFKEAFGTPAQ